MYSTENLKWNKNIFADCSETWTDLEKNKKIHSSKFNYLANGVGFIKIR